MSLLFIAPDRDLSSWKDAIHSVDPNIEIDIWPAIQDKERVQFAVCWNHPKHLLDGFPNLKAVSSLGAGADHLLSDESLPKSIDICRVVSPSLVQQMKEYILAAVLNIQRNFVRYIRQNDNRTWQPHDHPSPKELQVGVMGLGELGRPTAKQLTQLGYQVSGWSRSAKEIEGVNTFAGKDELHPFLNNIYILICLLPLTDETKGILNLDIFKQMHDRGWIINAARGEHLVDEDLIYALDSNILQGAWLDVFSEEPLPDKHAFWNRENVIITPHIASITKPNEVADQIVGNYKRALSGLELNHKVNRKLGY
ncbi:glyoxylate/hydroxypyruvate reductase A [Aliifodinibius salipaludis]|uniref:Glyoxylate/hydroxypyruvate reductase A n=1 Tax=Fodinibius salipaludis TaxID=2032627 RepID=A0A2A2G6W3_9BACT|nr:glyoxylate/hydroxypyruvate reductase A [Aliifodinibius salipaludis]PAU93506.1 glyoxylate/hydroxypyruvate reductase A [Aliifodinibius salipaludis]